MSSIKLTREQAIKEAKQLWAEIEESGKCKTNFLHSPEGMKWIRKGYMCYCPEPPHKFKVGDIVELTQLCSIPDAKIGQQGVVVGYWLSGSNEVLFPENPREDDDTEHEWSAGDYDLKLVMTDEQLEKMETPKLPVPDKLYFSLSREDTQLLAVYLAEAEVKDGAVVISIVFGDSDENAKKSYLWRGLSKIAGVD